MIRRREFMTLLGGAAAAWPMAARGQQAAMPVIGHLSGGSSEQFSSRVRAFHRGLGETGYVEGQNVAIEYRWTEGQADRLPAFAEDLIRRNVNVIVAAGGARAALAAKALTATIPIIFNVGDDPVTLGLVDSLNRPGGNLTGVSNLNVELGPKRLEIMREVMPTAVRFAILVNPTSPVTAAQVRDLQAAARTLRLDLHFLEASAERDFAPVFAKLAQTPATTLVIASDSYLINRSQQLGSLTARYAIPAIFQPREFVAAGGLMSYGGSATDSYRLIGLLSGRMLKGEKPADLPVMQATKVELIINLKTAKALGLTVPLLGRADEVIE